MIQKIGVIVQDANSIGLLNGLRRRFGCQADFIQPQPPVGKSTYLTRKQARAACAYFKQQGVDIIIRFTDADNDRWQDVKRSETNLLGKYSQVPIVCGVAVRNTEHWLFRMGVAAQLGVIPQASADPTDHVKGALDRMTPSGAKKSDYVAGLVAGQSPESFKQAFSCDALSDFYRDCRAIAKQFQCEVTNER